METQYTCSCMHFFSYASSHTHSQSLLPCRFGFALQFLWSWMLRTRCSQVSAGVCLQEVHWHFVAGRVLSLVVKRAAKALQAKECRTMMLQVLCMHNYSLSIRQRLIILLWYFSHGRTSYQILVSTDIVSVLEGLQLYYESHGHLTSDSCECFFVNADIALWLRVSGRTPRCIFKCCCRLSGCILGEGGQKCHESLPWTDTCILSHILLFQHSYK